MKDEMKILEITVVHRSDDTRIYQKYVRSLLEDGFLVGYIAPDPTIELAKGLTLFPMQSSNSVFVRLFRLLRKLPEINSFRPDYIHLHDPELLLISPIFKLLGFRVIYDMHENFARELDDKPLTWLNRTLQKFVWRVIEAFILSRITIVFAEKSYQKHFNTRGTGMVVQNFPRKKSVAKRFAPSEKCNSKPKFVYLGTISLDRGAVKMIESLERTFGANNYELHLIGDIPDPKLAVELGSLFSSYPDVKFHGYKSMVEAWDICKSCDVGLAILDAKHNYVESYPTKLFEYLICGLPIVTSNFELYRGLVEGNSIGYCVDPDDENDVSNALRNVVDIARYRELARNIREFSFDGFTWEAEFSAFLHYLRKT
jgi:glycosyltransferase involved in cell wall biosynthesis